MGKSKFNKDQVLDNDFALQSELDEVTGSSFDSVNMNNNILFNNLLMLKDNGSDTFDSLIMNNKSLYDLILSKLEPYKFIYPYNTNSTISSTTNTEIFNFNTPSDFPSGTYLLKYKYNYQPNTKLNPLAYLSLSIVFNQTIQYNLMYERAQPQNDANRSFLNKSFIILDLNAGVNNVSFQGYVSTRARPHTIGNFLFKFLKIS